MNRGLLIGIDYTNEYCQACFYNFRHSRPESVSSVAGDDRRFLIPGTICYSQDAGNWLIGNDAMEYADLTGAYLFENLLENQLRGEVCKVNDMEYSYTRLLMLYLARVIERVRAVSGMQTVDHVAVNLPRVNREIKAIFSEIFEGLSIPSKNVRLLRASESFAYYLLQGDSSLWRNGSVIFDLGADGIFARFLTVSGTAENNFIYINEKHNLNIAVRDLEDPINVPRMDKKLMNFYDEVQENNEVSSVFFTGEGFNEVWFKETLKYISRNKRAFKGNNIYAKGACMAAFRAVMPKGRDLPIICAGRTRVNISVDMRFKGNMTRVDLSRAAVDWYDADSSVDVVLDDADSIVFYITPIVSRQTNMVELPLEGFPKRPGKSTRLNISVKYRNDFEVDLIVKDKGFGDFFPASGAEVRRRLNLEEFI